MTEQAIHEKLDEAEEILGKISEAFGSESFEYSHALAVFQDLIVDPTSDGVLLGLVYLRWCMMSPHRIGKDEQPDSKSCDQCSKNVCRDGFILDDEELNTWRPCHRRLPQTHDNWIQETGYKYN